jgi:hypothetical protein
MGAKRGPKIGEQRSGKSNAAYRQWPEVKVREQGREKRGWRERNAALTRRLLFVDISFKTRQQRGGNTMTKYRIRLLVVLSLAVLTVAFVVPWSSTQADINCTGKCITGYNACIDWCNKHNKTDKSQLECSLKCDDYWHSGKNPQSIGRGDPTNPPQKIGPGRVKNPPTSVGGLPNPTPGKGPQEGKGRGGISGLPKSNPTPTASPSGPVLYSKHGKSTPAPTPKKNR